MQKDIKVRCGIKEMHVHQYVFEPINSNMFIIIDGKEAIIVDPNRSKEAMDLLKSVGVKKVIIILTHEHFDHTSGVDYYEGEFESILICNRYCAEKIAIEKNNRPLLVALVLKEHNEQEKKKELMKDYVPYKCKADVIFDDLIEIKWQKHNLVIRTTPGHTPGCCCVQFDHNIVFTGDSWIKNTPVITRFPGGNREEYEKITRPYLENLSNDSLIMPGHGETFRKGEVELTW